MIAARAVTCKIRAGGAIAAMRFASIVCLAVCVGAPSAARAADNWTEIKSAHFTVVSNASDGASRSLAWQLEQVRSTAATLWP